jgi:NAD(P)H-flavin reductase
MFMKSILEDQAVAVHPHPMVPEPWQVRRTRRETHDTFTLELESGEARDGFHFLAGQFNMLYMFGVGEVPISISGDPSKSQKLVHTIRAVGPVTKAMRAVRRGDALGVRGPFGSCWPLQEAAGKDVLIVAGGIGLAPLRPVVYEILAKRKNYGQIALLYGTRTPADMLYSKELEQWGKRADLQAHITVDRASGTWSGNVGVVPTLISKAQFNPRNTIAMICGPEVMMRFTVRDLQKYGVALENIYISMERNMKCAVGFCGHCQFGPTFICKEGPVFRYHRIQNLLAIREL